MLPALSGQPTTAMIPVAAFATSPSAASQSARNDGRISRSSGG